MLNHLKASTLCLFLACAPAYAEDILEVSGQVQSPATGQTWAFDLDALRALPVTQFETTTIWTEGTQTFAGVSLHDLLVHVGADDGTIRAVALNDYAVEIPTSDAVLDGPILAYLRNGEEMSIRDKGPLWIVYPFDDNDTYKSEEYYSRSIWQLAKIEIVTTE